MILSTSLRRHLIVVVYEFSIHDEKLYNLTRYKNTLHTTTTTTEYQASCKCVMQRKTKKKTGQDIKTRGNPKKKM